MNNAIDPADEKVRRPEVTPHAAKARADSDVHSPPSLGGLLSSLWRDTTDLLAQQAELAKAEASDKIRQLGQSVTAIAASGAVMLAGFIILLLSAVNALAMYLDPEYAAWLAPLIVGAVVVAIGYAMLAAGRKAMEAQHLKPSRSIEAMRSNTHMVKEHLQ